MNHRQRKEKNQAREINQKDHDQSQSHQQRRGGTAPAKRKGRRAEDEFVTKA